MGTNQGLPIVLDKKDEGEPNSSSSAWLSASRTVITAGNNELAK